MPRWPRSSCPAPARFRSIRERSDGADRHQRAATSAARSPSRKPTGQGGGRRGRQEGRADADRRAQAADRRPGQAAGRRRPIAGTGAAASAGAATAGTGPGAGGSGSGRGGGGSGDFGGIGASATACGNVTERDYRRVAARRFGRRGYGHRVRLRCPDERPGRPIAASCSRAAISMVDQALCRLLTRRAAVRPRPRPAGPADRQSSCATRRPGAYSGLARSASLRWPVCAAASAAWSRP